MNLRISNTVVNGKAIELVSGKANTGSPEFYEFEPSYMTTSGAGEVSSRFTTTGFFRDADGNTVRIRMNLWGKEAEEARKHLMASGRVATIVVTNARLSRYVDRKGVARASVNISSKAEYAVESIAAPQAETGFAAAAARAEAQAQHAGFDYSDAPF